MKDIGVLFCFVIFCVFLFVPIAPSNPIASKMFAVLVLMVLLWLTESLPLAITALLPIILFPVLNIAKATEVAVEYMNSTIFLFLGGFLLAIAIEKTNLHRLISIRLINFLGSSKDGLLLSFTLSTWVLSMFISNTASAIIMLPIVLSIIRQIPTSFSEQESRNLAKALLLTIAYSASVGGTATLIGTPPNLILQKIYQINYPELPQITFFQWLKVAFPLSLILISIQFLLLRLIFLQKLPRNIFPKESIIKTSDKLTPNQRITFAIFCLTCFLWIFRSPIEFGFFKIPGWSELLGVSNYIDDSTVAIFSAILLFLLPIRVRGESSKILATGDLSKVPWEIILLMGGGFALANGLNRTGLSDLIAQNLLNLIHPHPLILLIIICTAVIFFTEFSSNTAVASSFLPIIASISRLLGLSPIKLMVPATISASLAYMFPIATPPNAIVFSSGLISIKEMAKVGFLLNLIGILVISIYFWIFF
ncbi:MAG: SLC13 family permease [Ignavibacteria bacterium]|nr:SLC13 family permease [Ignavibacteria bacterium]